MVLARTMLVDNELRRERRRAALKAGLQAAADDRSCSPLERMQQQTQARLIKNRDLATTLQDTFLKQKAEEFVEDYRASGGAKQLTSYPSPPEVEDHRFYALRSDLDAELLAFVVYFDEYGFRLALRQNEVNWGQSREFHASDFEGLLRYAQGWYDGEKIDDFASRFLIHKLGM